MARRQKIKIENSFNHSHCEIFNDTSCFCETVFVTSAIIGQSLDCDVTLKQKEDSSKEEESNAKPKVRAIAS